MLIAGGKFLYQKNERRTPPDFRITRYPLTNAQYETFAAAGGYDDARWWNGLERLEYEPSPCPQANRPRTNVS